MTTEIAEALARIERQTAKTVETVGILNERQQATREDVAEIKEHQKEQNGTLLAVVKEQHETRGMVRVLMWGVGLILTGIGSGAALAGVILAYVSGG